MNAPLPDPSSPALTDLPFLPYLDDGGQLPPNTDSSIGIYAIFDRDRTLQYVGYSRNAAVSLAQHLIRQPHGCHWLKFHPIARPSRTLLDGIRDRWIAEAGERPPGNAADADLWEKPIDATAHFTAEDQAAIAAATLDNDRVKAIKAATRRVEARVLAPLEGRTVGFSLRFNPKLKERGLLDL